jgi:hypothetical protein
MPMAIILMIIAACCAGGAAVVTAAVARRGRSTWGDLLESPIVGVSDGAWTEYVVKWRGVRGLRTVTRDGRMGAFGFTARELSDVGLMSDLRKGPSGVWLGTWAPGLNLPAFLADARQQYHALVELSRQHAAVISSNYAKACQDLQIEGQPVTLSGLLAGARKAGLSGLRNWVEDAADRHRHVETTALVSRFSSIF